MGAMQCLSTVLQTASVQNASGAALLNLLHDQVNTPLHVPLSNFQIVSGFSRRTESWDCKVHMSETYVIAIDASNYLKTGSDFQNRQLEHFLGCQLSV